MFQWRPVLMNVHRSPKSPSEVFTHMFPPRSQRYTAVDGNTYYAPERKAHLKNIKCLNAFAAAPTTALLCFIPLLLRRLDWASPLRLLRQRTLINKPERGSFGHYCLQRSLLSRREVFEIIKRSLWRTDSLFCISLIMTSNVFEKQ